ncbi:MAG: type IV pilus secretin PilQ [Bdellovibrionia bacterium]
MKAFKKVILLLTIATYISSCAGKEVQEDISLDESPADSLSMDEGASSVEDEFEDFDGQNTSSADTAGADLEDQLDEAAETPNGGGAVEDFALDDAPPATNAAAEPPAAASEPVLPELETPPPAMEESSPVAEVEAPTEVQETIAPTEESTTSADNMSTGAPVQITGLNYKANENGGSVVIDANGPISYTTRFNSDLKQMIIEVDNATLPDRLKRTLNTRDIRGSIGAIDAYQNPGSTRARIVVQLRDGAEEPVVQTAGNSLVVVGGSVASNIIQGEGEIPETETTAGAGTILPVSKLEEFLVGNSKFYGKKISIEMNNMDIREALQFIMDESGLNMVISDRVEGKVSLKLRQVPWDQALVVIMRSRNLGYTRQGSVLRIATIEELRKEEEDALKLQAERQKLEPLKVRMYPVSYANVADLEKKLKEFMSDRGKVVADPRTNAVVVTETEENLARVDNLIQSLDVKPPQVLIEGKIVEAKETFSRAVGVRWSAAGSDIKLGQTRRGNLNLRPNLRVNPTATGSGNLNLNLAIGTLDIFGNLEAALSLRELQEQVKVISSPRILVLTNEVANISQTQEVPVRQITQNGSSTQETFQFKPLSLKMEVTPQVTSDGSIMMKLGVARQIRGADVGSGDSTTFSVDSREANTRVLVQNGQTAVVGGIYNSEMTSGEDGVPWLRELPIVGSLFKTSRQSRSKTELLVFITPRIVGTPDSKSGSNSRGL